MAEFPAGYRPQGEVGQPGHEPTDVGIRIVLIVGAILVVVCALVTFGLSRLMGSYQAEQRAAESSRPPLFRDDAGQFPEPTLQHNPHDDLSKMRKADHDELTRYGWVDRKAGVVKIPIERAMEIVARKGLPQPGSETAEKPAKSADEKSQAKPGGGGG